MKDTKTALNKLTSFINSMVIIGSVGLAIGVVTYALGAQRMDAGFIGLGTLLLITSCSTFGLAVVGSFLRQTANIIVEGLQDNRMDSANSYANISFTTDGSREPQ